jgi:hypothetical protein
MADEDTVIVIDGNTYSMNSDDLELWEIELLEETMDTALEDIDFNRAKALRVLVYVLMHRKNSKFTLEDAKHIKVASIEFPDQPNGNGAAKKRPTKPRAAS